MRVYRLWAAVVSVPVFVTSAATGYWEGMAIGAMLCVMGLLGYRRAKTGQRLLGGTAARVGPAPSEEDS